MIADKSIAWDRVVDVIVIGSGAAGLAAATLAHDGGAEVLVLEKAPQIGGTTGVSGGMPWIPLNRHMESGSRDDALRYIRRLTAGREPDPALVEVYVDRAAEMLEYLEANTPLRITVQEVYPDYYAHLPGGRTGGRSVEPAPFDAKLLGSWASRVRTSAHFPWRLTIAEGALARPGMPALDFDLAARREAEDIRVLGSALVSALTKGLLDRGVSFETDARALELVMANGAVIGVRSSSGMFGTRRGTVLACGGFEWNADMVDTFIGQRITPLSPPFNEGDGIRMAVEAGATLGNMRSFWGQLGICEPGFEIDGRPVAQMAGIRFAGGAIMVNRHGCRFVKEDVVYHDFHKVVERYDPVTADYPDDPPYWLIIDQSIKDSAVILPSVLPDSEAPSWIWRSDTIAGLAEAINVPAASLESTIARWNENVRSGSDTDFKRAGIAGSEAVGENFDAGKLQQIRRAPFYAVEIVNGALGTNGGVLIDEFGRARRQAGGVVNGLYAAGNATACVFGPAYPGGGSTIGPALTFGYLAGRHAATNDTGFDSFAAQQAAPQGQGPGKVVN